MVFPPTPSGKMGLANHSFPSAPGPTKDGGERPAGRATSKTILTSQTDGGVCFSAYLDVGEQSARELLNKNSFAPFLHFFLSLFLYYYYFLTKRKKPLLAQSLKSLTCDVNLSSLAASHCCWLCACLISWPLRAGCVSVSIMKLGFGRDGRTVFQAKGPHSVPGHPRVGRGSPPCVYRLLGLEGCFCRALWKSFIP